MKRSALILLALATAAFIIGVVQLFNLRFESGDVYPKYSSFRADPLGAKALYESLAPLVPVSRHLERLSKLGDGQECTLLYLGADPGDLQFRKHELQSLETFVASGGRLVISLLTQYKQRSTPPSRPQPEETLISAESRWGFEFKYAQLPKTNDQYLHATAIRLNDEFVLPQALLWHTAVYFDKLDPAWNPIYAISNHLPVLIEREFGAGKVILCTDSYPLSNEALLADLHPHLLSWLVGPSRRVIFDETHLGVREDPGLATLFRHYRLHGLAAALLLLALLFIWKSSDSFIPLPEIASSAQSIIGRDAATGFTNLLRRNISRADLVGTCIEEWKRSASQRVSRQRLERVQQIINDENELPPARRDPVRIYRAIRQSISIS